ncbi:MAG TPA: universal stress protein [Candidatus Deferrimicrobiaceae bacterium]|nr:universal stress protein [Candidatus Deferrimicrobiaceae bacterium]
MRVLFATDGSRSADLARDLIATLPWPEDTRIRIVSVVEDRHVLPRLQEPLDALEAVDDALARHVTLTLDGAVAALDQPGRSIDRIVLEGRPASAIIEEARGYGAQLIVLGSHGHSRIASMLLGSTSAEVVARAHCPVLVARDAVVEEIILGADTSMAARQAETVVGWPVFHDLPASVVSVAAAYVPWIDALPGVVTTEALEAEAYEASKALARARTVADSVVARLEQVGVRAEATAVEGDAAAELVSFAMARPHALLVVGSRAHGGLAKLLLGGVARNVLQHAAGSVLVVPETIQVRDEARTNGSIATLSSLLSLALG